MVEAGRGFLAAVLVQPALVLVPEVEMVPEGEMVLWLLWFIMI